MTKKKSSLNTIIPLWQVFAIIVNHLNWISQRNNLSLSTVPASYSLDLRVFTDNISGEAQTLTFTINNLLSNLQDMPILFLVTKCVENYHS